jgi:uncharacterized protein (UPF0261 family)
VDAQFALSLHRRLRGHEVRELDLHINDPAFADACVTTMLDLMRDTAS